MANYATLKASIQDVIKQNGNNEITGALLQQSLLAMISSLGANYQYAGIAKLTPTQTDPGTPDQNVFYIASEPGTYSNFDGLTVADGEVAIFKYNGTWSKEVTGAATAVQVTELAQKFIQKEPVIGGVVQNGFFGNDLNFNYQGAMGGWTAVVYAVNPAKIGIIINAAPRSSAYVSLTDSNDNILWQSNNAADFPKKIDFANYPAAAKVYLSNETRNLATPGVDYYETAFDAIDILEKGIVVQGENTDWQSGFYINADGEPVSLSNWASLIMDVSDAIMLKLTATFNGAASYLFLDDAAGNHLLELSNATLTNYVVNLGEYPGAAMLKICSREANPHSVIVAKLKVPAAPISYSPVTLRRGSFNSNNIIVLPSPFSSFPIPVKLSYYDNCVGWNLSAQDYTKNNSYGATYFISPTGDDTADGLTPSTAFRSIDHALSQEDVNTIVLLNGTYTSGKHFTAGMAIAKEVNFIGYGNVILQNRGAAMEVKASTYFENITFVGGVSTLKVVLRDEVCAFYRCKFMNSDANNGLSTFGGVCILEECEASNNMRDGFNYHKNEDDGYIAYALEINCTAFYNGVRHDTDINNGSTMHDGGIIIRVLCTYGYSRGTLVADTGRAKSYNIGVVAYSTQNLTGTDSYKANYGQQYTGGDMYLIGCRSFGSKYDVFAETGSRIYRTAPFPKETGGGSFSPYTPTYE